MQKIKKSSLEIAIEQMLLDMSDSQLINLTESIEKILADRKKSFSNIEEKGIQISDDSHNFSLIIDKSNTIKGIDNSKEKLVIGKLGENLSALLLQFSLERPFIQCFRGKINQEKLKLEGNWFGENHSFTILREMKETDYSVNRLDDINNASLNTDILHMIIKDTRARIINYGWKEVISDLIYEIENLSTEVNQYSKIK